MDNDSYDDYIRVNNKTELYESVYDIVKYDHDNGYNVIFSMINNVSPNIFIYTFEDNKRCYGKYLATAKSIRQIAQEINDQQLFQKIDALLKAVYDLDVNCGQNDLDPNIKEQLQKLDEDRDQFIKFYVKHSSAIDNRLVSGYKEMARFLFRCNGYQAPPRISPLQAFQDALGQTDVFEELVQRQIQLQQQQQKTTKMSNT